MVIELGGSVLKNTHDLLGDLFRAKNAGVTALFWCPLPKFPVGPEKQSFSRDWWLVVVTVVV
jgi:hypothetical protein